MAMKPAEFFRWIVGPNLGECWNWPGTIRHAFTAAASLVQCAELHLAHSQQHEPAKVEGFESVDAFLDHLSKESGDAFGDVRDLANASRRLSAGDGKVDVQGAYRIERLQWANGPLASVYILYSKEDIQHEDPFRVILERRDGTRSDVGESLIAAANSLCDALGVPRLGSDVAEAA